MGKNEQRLACRGVMRRRGRRERSGGFTLIEVLVASVIVGTCIAAVVTMWAVAFKLSSSADRTSVAYSIGRRALEEVKETGFQDSTEGTSTLYYDPQGANRSATRTSVHCYAVVTSVATDVMNGSAPAAAALRTITVTVRFLNPDSTVYQCSTYLARAGI
jgi:prepilin-type N-terminal cleavage/methylation domain-containing protein